MSKEIVYDKWQQEILDYDGHILVKTGRQVGKTETFAAKISQYMLRNPNSRIIVVSLTEDQAQLMIIMVLNYLERHNKPMIAKGTKKPTKGRIFLKNGSMVLARPVGNTGDAVRGFTGDVLVVDEASKMPEMMWAAAKPVLMTMGGQIWMCSTPFGKQGYFYECWVNKNNKYKVFNITSETVVKERPISESWTIERRKGAIRHLEEEKLEMSELEYAQEYLGQFIDDLRQLFSDKIIAKAMTLRRTDTSKRRYDHFLGVDIARMGEDQGTYEVITRINDHRFQHSENIVTKKKLTTDTFDRIKDLNSQWNFRKIGIDAGSGSLGVGILDFLLREPNLKSKIIALNNQRRVLDSEGKRARNLLKEDMYFNLLALLEKQQLQLLKDNNLRLSLKSVQYEYIRKQGQPTKIRIFSSPHYLSDIAEGLVRAAWLANQKHLKSFISYI